MQKRVVIIHGWDGHPEKGWFPWLKQELESLNYHVSVPAMPDAATPRIENWIPAISQTVGNPDEQTLLIGHSMGCQAIARYLETLPAGLKIGGAIFVAGFFHSLTNPDGSEESDQTVKHWLERTIDLQKVRSHVPRSIAIFSDNDPLVPLINQQDFQEQLNSEIIIKNNSGHFSGDMDGMRELPVALEKILGF